MCGCVSKLLQRLVEGVRGFGGSREGSGVCCGLGTQAVAAATLLDEEIMKAGGTNSASGVGGAPGPLGCQAGLTSSTSFFAAWGLARLGSFGLGSGKQGIGGSSLGSSGRLGHLVLLSSCFSTGAGFFCCRSRLYSSRLSDLGLDSGTAETMLTGDGISGDTELGTAAELGEETGDM